MRGKGEGKAPADLPVDSFFQLVEFYRSQPVAHISFIKSKAGKKGGGMFRLSYAMRKTSMAACLVLAFAVLAIMTAFRRMTNHPHSTCRHRTLNTVDKLS